VVKIERERTIPAAAAQIWEVVASADRLPQWYARSGKVEVLEGVGQPAPRFALETVVRIKLEADGEASTRVVMESRQRPADLDKERAMRGNSEYLAKMLETSLERLEKIVTNG